MGKSFKGTLWEIILKANISLFPFSLPWSVMSGQWPPGPLPGTSPKAVMAGQGQSQRSLTLREELL